MMTTQSALRPVPTVHLRSTAGVGQTSEDGLLITGPMPAALARILRVPSLTAEVSCEVHEMQSRHQGESPGAHCRTGGPCLLSGLCFPLS